ncbi:methylmalonyl-CoA mutase subunit beta [Formosa haliotis]|uniref:methylmalonyl-CoA mutase subunit beta n=1 Tax=Formosa haliotis TaxID=1555194 RepID=UPI0008270A97|nr:methylmalonyl-CoA mutase subunit beta [Formosa haliotis]
MSKANLFDEFDPVSAKAWKQKIQFDLKGADYNNTLIWNSNEGIHVKPFYTNEDLKSPSYTSNTNSLPFNITQSIFVNSEEKSNLAALNALQNGAEALHFIISNTTCKLERLFESIDLHLTPIYFELQFCSADFVIKLDQIASKNNALFYVNFDSIGHLAETGNWYTTLQSDHKTLESILKTCRHLKSNVSVNMALYQNAGANITQQLAYSLAHANEYLNLFAQHIKSRITFKVAIGSNYFFEIAKLRALRMLWKTVAQTYNLSPDCHIIAFPTKRNKTLYDVNTNMLRTTTECMSAILGGADSVCNLAFDAVFHKNNAFGERISRNQLIILKEESAFGAVNNPADGSYYIETLTLQLAEQALDLFKDLEANGGFLKALKAGLIQKKIKESALKEQEQFNANDIILVGTNAHTNPKDQMKDNLELYPFVKQNPRKTLIEPVIQKRLAETLEQTRLKAES